MGIVFRQSVKASIVTFVGAMLGAICNFAYVKILPLQENGFRNSIFDQSQVLQFAILLGSSALINTFALRHDPGPKRKMIQTLGLIAPLLGFTLLLIPYLIFKEQILQWYNASDREFVARYYIWIPILVIQWSYLFQLEGYLHAHHKVAIASFMREVFIRLVNIVLIALYFYQIIGFSTFIIGCILVYGFAVALLLIVARKTEGFGFTTNWRVFSKKEYFELFHFSWYHLLMGISVFAIPSIGTYMLGIFSKSGFETVSVYGTAIFISGIMIIPFRAMAAASYTSINLAYNENDESKLKNLFERSAINIMLVSVIMAVLIGCNMHNVIQLINKKGYEELGIVTIILMLGRLSEMATGLNTELISISKHYKFNFRITLLLLAMLIISNYLLIPKIDVFGAAWGMAISLFLFNIAKTIFLNKKFEIKTITPNTLKVLLAGLIAGICGYFLPVIGNWFTDAIVRSCIIFIVYGLMIFYLKPSADLQVFVQGLYSKITKRNG